MHPVEKRLARRPSSEGTEERLGALHGPFRPYRRHMVVDCTRTCPKRLNPGKATGLAKTMIFERRS